MSDPLQAPLKLNAEDSLLWLNKLLTWYSEQETYYYKKLWGDEDEREPGAFSIGMESEWMRYRQEAGALRSGIEAIHLSLNGRDGA